MYTVAILRLHGEQRVRHGALKLDTIILGFVIFGAVCWSAALLFGMIAAFPIGLIGLAIYGVLGYILLRVVLQRLRNSEDDYYEKNIDQ